MGTIPYLASGRDTVTSAEHFRAIDCQHQTAARKRFQINGQKMDGQRFLGATASKA